MHRLAVVVYTESPSATPFFEPELLVFPIATISVLLYCIVMRRPVLTHCMTGDRKSGKLHTRPPAAFWQHHAGVLTP